MPTDPTPPSAGAHLPGSAPPSPWVQRWLAGLGPSRHVLDFASGHGRNIQAALQQGADVLAVDRDNQAVAAVDPRARRLVADLEGARWPWHPGAFDAVICCNYLFRARLDLLAGLLAPAGRRIYETFADGNAQYGRPSNPEFLLHAGELLELARRAGLTVIAYECGFVERPKPARVQRLCALRPPVDFERLRLDAPVS